MSTDGVVVRGGMLSTEARIDDLRRAAGELDRSGHEAGRLAAYVVQVAAGLPVTSAALAPGTAVHVTTLFAGLTIGQSSLVALACRMTALAGGVRGAADAYEDADRVITAAFRSIRLLSAPVHLLGGVRAAAGRATLDQLVTGPGSPLHPGTALEAWGLALGRELEAEAVQDPGLTGAAVDTLRELFWAADPAALSFESQVGLILGVGRAGGIFRDGSPLTVTPVTNTTGDRTRPAPRGVGDLIAQEAWQESPTRAGSEHALVRVHHVTGPDGAGAWIVNIPGTQNWKVNGPHNPADATANLATMADVPSSLYPAVTAAMATAMRTAGVRPGSEPVMLVGHSQGGIVATRMVQNPAFRRRFDVTQVVTVASPVTRMRVPKGVQSLEIEHPGDVVPALDAEDRPTHANTTQITLPAGISTSDPLALHSPALYAKDARRWLGRRSRIDSMPDFYRRNRRFFTGRDTVYDYYLRRP